MLIITLLIISMLTMVGFAPAETAYWEEMKEVYEWNGVEGDSEVEIVVNFPPELNEHYRLNMYSKADLKDFTSYIEIKIENIEGKQDIPTIKMYTKGSDFYINKEAVLSLLSAMDIKENVEIEEEYIVLRNNASTVDINANLIKDMITFIENMDLGVELGMTKEGNTYTLTLDSDKIIDLLDAYIRYIISNMDKLSDTLMQPEIEISKEEMAEALEAYDKNIATYKEIAKEFISGSYYKLVTTIGNDKVDASTETLIKAPMAEIKVTAVSTSSKLDSPNIKLPTSIKVITEEDLTELIMGGLVGHSETTVETTNMELKAAINRDGSYMKFGEFDVEEGNIQLKVENGRSYVPAEEVSRLLEIELEKEGLIAIKNLEDYGFHVYWDAENKTIDIYQIEE